MKVRYWPKADPIFREFDQFGTSAFRPEADIRLNLPKRSANDPKGTSVTCPQFAIQLLYLGH